MFDTTFPHVKHTSISSIRDFREISKMSKWSMEKLVTKYKCTGTDWKQEDSHPLKNTFRLQGTYNNKRRDILRMLDTNKRSLIEQNQRKRQIVNFSYIKLFRMNNQLSNHSDQVKVKRTRVNIEAQPRQLPGFIVQVDKGTKQKTQPQKIQTVFTVAIQNIEYLKYQKFYGFREGGCLAVCDKNLYLFGGYSGEVDNRKSYLNQFDFNSKVWISPTQKTQSPEFSMIGQSVQQWRGNLYFIGGMGLNLMGKKRIFSSQINIFNPQRGQWSKMKALQGRRYHASSRYLNYIIVYGGINDAEQYIGNITIINIQNINSSSVSFQLPQDSGGVAYHKIVSTMQLDIKKRGDIIKDGIYSFGGKNNNSEFITDLKVLNLQINSNCQLVPKQWIKVKTEGVGPRPRINHSMNLLPRLCAICVVGGQSPSNTVFTDIFFLNLFNLNWYSPQIMFDQFLHQGVGSHSSVVLGSKIYIFGGLQSNDKYSTKLVEIQTDQNRIHSGVYHKLKKSGMLEKAVSSQTTF